MIKFKKLAWKLEIEEVEIIRETKEFVVYKDTFYKKERREAKAGTFFDTFEEAKAHFVAQAELELRHANGALSRAIDKLARAQKLVPPAPKVRND